MNVMAADSGAAFSALKAILARHAASLSVIAETPSEYTLAGKTASPFPQHKGQPLQFGSVRLGKAYVSLHLMPLYMCPALNGSISPALKKRMQGKTCFNFKKAPDPVLATELEQLIGAALEQWVKLKWL